MRVLHLPTNVAGMAWGLAQGERRLGLDSRVLATSRTWLDYPCDICLEWQNRNRLGRLLSGIKAFLEIRNRFDVFHFNFGKTLIDLGDYGLGSIDLPLYPRGSKIIFTYNGCDARQKYKSIDLYKITACSADECYNGICLDGRRDRRKVRSISGVAKYAHHIFAVNPDLLNFLPEKISSFLPYAIGPWYGIEQFPILQRKKFRIVHSPTNRAAKGSSYIIAALDNLSKRYDIETVLVENIPNQQALEIYKSADLVIDQVLIGWYGGFAVEVMKMGKPVAVYIREEDLKHIPKRMAEDLLSAVINISPFSIEETLELYLQNRELLAQKSQASMEYVNRWHDPVYVANLTKEVYES